MELNGKWLAIWLPANVVLEDILAIPAGEGQTEQVQLGGTVVGETPQLGLWIEVGSILRDDLTPLLPGFEKWHRRPLVRWELIRSAVVFDAAPSAKEAMGFRPPAR